MKTLVAGRGYYNVDELTAAIGSVISDPIATRRRDWLSTAAGHAVDAGQRLVRSDQGKPLLRQRAAATQRVGRAQL